MPLTLLVLVDDSPLNDQYQTHNILEAVSRSYKRNHRHMDGRNVFFNANNVQAMMPTKPVIFLLLPDI
jgi:hypothetical protein